MKPRVLTKSFSLLMCALLAACTLGQKPLPASLPADAEATIAAALYGTQTAEAGMQTAIAEAVASTEFARPTTAPVNPEELTEVELAAIVENSVTAALGASETASLDTGQAVADGEVTQDELETAYSDLAYYDQLINEAIYLAELYLNLYGDLSTETVDLLEEILAELNDLSAYIDEINATLGEITRAMQQGQEAAQTVLDKLEEQSSGLRLRAGELQLNNSGFASKVQYEANSLADKLLALQPEEVAGTLAATVDQLRGYVSAVREGLSDGKLNAEELNRIGKLGANAAASLEGLGGQELLGLAEKVRALTGQLARGQLPQARGALDELENAIPRPRD